MRVDQNEGTTTPQSRRAFLTRVVVAAAAMTFGVAETEAAPNAAIGNVPKDIPNDKDIAQGEKIKLAETVGQDDRMQGAYGRYGHYRRVTRRVYRRAYRRSYYY
jgi:hypothetical protein